MVAAIFDIGNGVCTSIRRRLWNADLLRVGSRDRDVRETWCRWIVRLRVGWLRDKRRTVVRSLSLDLTKQTLRAIDTPLPVVFNAQTLKCRSCCRSRRDQALLKLSWSSEMTQLVLVRSMLSERGLRLR